MALPVMHRLRIADVRAETNDSISVAFDIPDDLHAAYRFQAGQFLTLASQVSGEALRRSYSICSSQAEYAGASRLRVGIRQVNGGRFSNWARDHLKPGEAIEVMTPDGRFGIAFAHDRRAHYLGIAGGSGITPVLSLIKTALETEADSRFTLIYGNRSVSSIMFLEELEGLKNRYLERLALFHVLSEEATEIELLSGLLDEARMAQLLARAIPTGDIAHAFVCGPAPMMDAAERALVGAGLPRERIRIERFASPDGPQLSSGRDASTGDAGVSGAQARAIGAGRAGCDTRSATDASPGARVTVVIDGKARALQVPFGGSSILDVGIAAGLNLPFACKAGVCCTCRAKVLEGEVRMDRHYTLEPHEIAAGFVLTCQSHPVSETVRLSYDER